jgi:hypothetical protein
MFWICCLCIFIVVVRNMAHVLVVIKNHKSMVQTFSLRAFYLVMKSFSATVYRYYSR